MAMGTEEVVMHHVRALASGSLDAVMEDYAGDAIIFTPNGISKGLDGIRENFKAIMGMLTPEVMANMKIIEQDIDGEYAYAVWTALPVVPFGSDTFHVHDGKIMMQSFAGQMGPR